MQEFGNITEIVVVAIASMVIALVARRQKILDLGGAVLSFVICFVIGTLAHWSWFILLLIFVAGSYLATLLGFRYKIYIGVQEGTKGMRSETNVISNGSIPSLVAIMYFFEIINVEEAIIGFTTSLAVAAADTIASEIGVLGGEAVLITSPSKRVPPGTNGGITVIGTVSALLASICMTFISLIVIFAVDFGKFSEVFGMIFVIIPVILGFVGCQIDSVLGATLENRGIIGKGGVNFVSIGISTVLSIGIFKYLY